MNRYTEEQQKAFDSSIHISVNANAGSGKTSVLIERYLRLLLEEFTSGNQNINSIVAITFTKLAAQEMKSRIILKIEKLINEFGEEVAREYNTNLKDLKKVREKMSVAPVMTIHSFCYSLLREFPIEANISPNYSELDEYEAFLFKNSAIDEVLENIYSQPDLFPDEYELLVRYGMKPINNNIVIMLNSKEKLREIKQLYCRTNEELISELTKFYLNLLSSYFSKLKDFTQSSGYDYDKIKVEAESAVANSILILEKSDISVKDYVNIYFDLAKFRLGRSLLFTKYHAFLDDHLPEFDYEMVVAFCKEYFPNWDYSFKYFNDVRTLIKISDKALNSLMDKQHEEAKYDFDDSMLFTLDLLERNDFDARKKIARRINYLMVDEFQDTNELQYEIIKHIIEISENELPQNRLFIVGDPKQSIYGFRSADVKVFGKATEDIVKLNSRMNKSDDSQHQIGQQNLTVTFRLRPILTAFNNLIFNSLMGQNIESEGSEYEVTYSPFVAGRMIDELTAEENWKRLLPNHFGSVHCLVTVIENDIEKNIALDSVQPEYQTANNLEINSEEDLVINFILKAINGESEMKVYDPEVGERLPRLGDFAILSAKKKSIQKMSLSLMDNNLPHVVTSGRGFYDAQEVIDIITFLTFINNPSDDLALASILRSPMFGIADSTILRISRLQNYDTLYDKFFHFTHSDSFAANERCHRAIEIINNFLEISVELPLPRLINKIISETAYIGLWAGQSPLPQIKANLNQLIKFAIAFESRGFSMLHDFIKQFEILSEISGEKEASFNTSDDAIKLMTCHASKGLEFPIVILYKMNDRSGSNDPLKINKDCGVKMNFKYSKERSAVPLRIDVPSKQYIEFKSKQAETAELKRLLYVAFTRAKDHLVFSTQIKLNKNGDATTMQFADLLRKAHPVFSPASLMSMEKLNLPFIERTFSASQMIYKDEKVQAETFDFDFNINFHFHSDRPEVNYYKFGQTQSEKKLKLLTGQFIPDSLEQVGFISASKYALFKNDIKAFADRYILGLVSKQSYSLIDIDLDDVKDDTPGTQIGLVLHHVLENIELWMDSKKSVMNDKLKGQIIQSSKKFGLSGEAIIERIFNDVLKTINSKFIKSNLDKLLNAERELVLNMPYRNSSLAGVIDLLISDNDDIIEIWDWKSNSITKEQMNQVAESYIPQLEFYAYMIAHLYRSAKTITCRLIFTHLANDESEDWYFTYTIDSADIGNLINKIESDFDEILLLS